MRQGITTDSENRIACSGCPCTRSHSVIHVRYSLLVLLKGELGSMKRVPGQVGELLKMQDRVLLYIYVLFAHSLSRCINPALVP
jgi:hypothetical protein